jgi:hypothetical protein
MPKTDNPLAKFFRQPAIYIRLPSGGKSWAAGAITVPANGEFPVYPMTAIDEITYRTPDALFNGEAVIAVIQSCMPNIHDAWACPSIDLDAILVAIRIASYGHSMDIGSKCPSCENEHDFGLDLRQVIDNLKSADYSQSLEMGDLTVYLRPLDYREMTENSNLQFEQQKTLQVLGDTEISNEQKAQQLNAMMKKIMEFTVHSLAQSIQEIRTNDTAVYDIVYIEEFLNNCDRAVFARLRDHAIELRQHSEVQPVAITCSNCSHEYQQPFTLDMSSFFADAS